MMHLQSIAADTVKQVDMEDGAISSTTTRCRDTAAPFVRSHEPDLRGAACDAARSTFAERHDEKKTFHNNKVR